MVQEVTLLVSTWHYCIIAFCSVWHSIVLDFTQHRLKHDLKCQQMSIGLQYETVVLYTNKALNPQINSQVLKKGLFFFFKENHEMQSLQKIIFLNSLKKGFFPNEEVKLILLFMIPNFPASNFLNYRKIFFNTGNNTLSDMEHINITLTWNT